MSIIKRKKLPERHSPTKPKPEYVIEIKYDSCTPKTVYGPSYSVFDMLNIYPMSSVGKRVIVELSDISPDGCYMNGMKMKSIGC